jgi:hypothetical protein
MTREDEKFFKAVISLQGNPDFEIVREKIKMTYFTICQTWYKQQPDKYGWLAGQAQALAQVIYDLNPLKASAELDAAKRAIEKPNPGSTL